MSEPDLDMSTDSAWEEWGRRDPYFGVITQPRFRRSAMTEDVKLEFFQSGAHHAQHVLTTIRNHINPDFVPRRILDFGCGVGRLLLPFAEVAAEVVGVDVSPSMLQEARRNCDAQQLRNVRLLQSDDCLSTLTDSFDLIHSFIVFQHIPVERGRSLIAKLLRHTHPGGVVALHLTYSKSQFAPNYGLPPVAPPARKSRKPEAPVGPDPAIQMNPYNMNEILFLIQSCGARKFHAEFSDHGGELGVFLFFSVAETDVR